MKKVFLSMAAGLFLVFAMSSCGGGIPVEQLTDQEILTRIHAALNGPEWQGSQGENWLSENPIGEWKNVRTNDSGRVISLRIQGDGVQGLIPAEIGGLTELKELYIYSKDYDNRNVIPSEIGNLKNLKTLSLTLYSDSKSDSPVIPDLSTLGNLESLYISGLNGVIPESIAKLSNLKILNVQNFKGEIPEGICKLTELEDLNLKSGYQPEGAVPGCIGKLSNLKSLVIDYNTGTAGGINQPNVKFPESIWDLTNLEYLFVRSLSNAGGPIPGNKVAKMTNLKRLTIINCGIAGEIPAELFASDKLTDLSIYNNNLTGSIPAEIGNCSKLTTIRLNKNQLTGNIPAELAKCEKLNIFDVSDNQLSPELPADLKAHPDFSKFKF